MKKSTVSLLVKAGILLAAGIGCKVVTRKLQDKEPEDEIKEDREDSSFDEEELVINETTENKDEEA